MVSYLVFHDFDPLNALSGFSTPRSHCQPFSRKCPSRSPKRFDNYHPSRIQEFVETNCDKHGEGLGGFCILRTYGSFMYAKATHLIQHGRRTNSFQEVLFCSLAQCTQHHCWIIIKIDTSYKHIKNISPKAAYDIIKVKYKNVITSMLVI